MNGAESHSVSIFEIAALLGALAWLPYIFNLLKNYIIKPEIKIVLQKYAELGFTSLGHIFNIKIAFSVKHKDVVISGIRIKILHESGDEKFLSWQGITQRFFELKREGSSYPMEREQSVLAIKLNQKDIEERFIRFQDGNYLLKKHEYEQSIFRKTSNLQKSDSLNFESVVKLEEYQNMLTYIKQSYNWKPGKYKLSFLLESPDKITVLDNEYSFELNNMDIESLEKNKEFIKKSYEQIYKILTKSEEKEEDIFWNWVYPFIKK